MTIKREDLATLDYGDLLEPGAERLPPTAPGDILSIFLRDYGLNASRLAILAQVPANRITGIVNGTRAITADTALRLGRVFGVSPEYWMNLQSYYDLETARRASGQEIEATVRQVEDAA